MPRIDIRLRTNTQLAESHVRELTARGLRLVSKLPGGSYRVRSDTTATIAELAALDFVDTATTYKAADKLDPTLQDASTSARPEARLPDSRRSSRVRSPWTRSPIRWVSRSGSTSWEPSSRPPPAHSP